MKIRCDVCEKAPATVICCADEAALCGKCDVEVHAANKLASKHQRLQLHHFSNKLPICDICQEKTAFIFCVEDRALFCRDCDEPIHSAGSRSANHQRFLATGIQVALNSNCSKDAQPCPLEPKPPNPNAQVVTKTTTTTDKKTATTMGTQQACGSPAQPWWAVDDLLQLSDLDSSHKKEQQLEFGELEWFKDIGFFGEQVPEEPLAAAEVPQLRTSLSPLQMPLASNATVAFNRPAAAAAAKFNITHQKKPKFKISVEDEDSFTVPNMG